MGLVRTAIAGFGSACLASVALACLAPGGAAKVDPAHQKGASTQVPARAPFECTKPPANTLALSAAGADAEGTLARCPFALTQAQGELRIERLDPVQASIDSRVAAAETPPLPTPDATLTWSAAALESCSNGDCEYQLADTAAGVLVLVGVRPPAQDGVVALWLAGPGLADRLEATQSETAYLPLWGGESSLVDSSDFGALYELVPYVCGAELRLRLGTREAQADLLDAPSELVALAHEDGGAFEGPGCSRVLFEMP